MAEKSVVQKSSSRNELEFLRKELANTQRHRRALGLTTVATEDLYLALNASLLPPMQSVSFWVNNSSWGEAERVREYGINITKTETYIHRC